MILPNTRIRSRQNEQSEYSGIDSLDNCHDPDHFAKYPYNIEYQYNSRGFRDQEWPDNLSDCIWCIGDSFTSGVGVPYAHTWAQVLQQRTGRRTINVSLDGGSNNWIARQVQVIREALDPKHIIVHWSYSHRREKELSEVLEPLRQIYLNGQFQEKFDIWIERYDLESARRIQFTESTADEDLENIQNCINLAGKVIHSFIPQWHLEPANLTFDCDTVIPEFKILDLARDGHHYDILTSQNFVDQILKHF